MLQRRIQEEYERCQNYLEPGTRRHLIKVVEQQLLEAHMGALLDRGFDGLMAEQRILDLARFYTLAARVQALPALKQRLKDYIRTSGLALIMDEEKVPLSASGLGPPLPLGAREICCDMASPACLLLHPCSI